MIKVIMTKVYVFPSPVHLDPVDWPYTQYSTHIFVFIFVRNNRRLVNEGHLECRYFLEHTDNYFREWLPTKHRTLAVKADEPLRKSTAIEKKMFEKTTHVKCRPFSSDRARRGVTTYEDLNLIPISIQTVDFLRQVH